VSKSVASHVELHPNAAEARRFPYGAVTNAFRAALRGAGPWGLNREDLIGKASEILEADVGGMDHRDTFKRLKKSQEMRIENGRYFAGPKLAGRKENGAPATLPLDAPETAQTAL
jgi:hypothetical protein